MPVGTAKCESERQNTSQIDKMQVGTIKHKLEWQNASRDGKRRVGTAKGEWPSWFASCCFNSHFALSTRILPFRVGTTKCELGQQNASRNGKMLVETTKCKSEWQNASRNGKMRVGTAKCESVQKNAKVGTATESERQNASRKG